MPCFGALYCAVLVLLLALSKLDTDIAHGFSGEQARNLMACLLLNLFMKQEMELKVWAFFQKLPLIE